jgi:benzoyl-CoA reductase/2-hydroxyglutaryl-CoA dehydratase subunit BcrC/BadD/HgdB
MNNIADNILALKHKGHKVMGCFPLYPPMEIFYAMDLVPGVLWGLKDAIKSTAESDRHLQTYTCSVARHLTEFVLTEGRGMLDGIFMYNACDTLRNLPEIITKAMEESGRPLPLIHIHIPMVLPEQTDASAYFKNEINQLISTLETQFDRVFSKEKFKEAVTRTNRIRRLMADAEKQVASGAIRFLNFSQAIHSCWFSTLEDQAEILEALLSGGEKGKSEKQGERTGVILSGILPPPASVIEAIESSGLTVVGNDIASLGRTYASMPKVSDDPDTYFLDFYYQHFPCPTLLYSGDRRTTSLFGLVENSGAKAVIFIGEKFCEYEYFEFPFLNKQLNDRGVKTLEIEIAIDDDAHTSAHQSRIEAFAEMLKSTI